MTDDKDEALRLAEMLEQKASGLKSALGDLWGDWVCKSAADQLRSQHARIAELEAELREAKSTTVSWAERCEAVMTSKQTTFVRAKKAEARAAELQADLAEQCRINAMGAERELSALNRVRELEAVARVALEQLERWNANGGVKPGYEFIDAAIASLRKTLGEA